VRIGLLHDFGALFMLPRTGGMQKAKELMFTGRVVDLDEAKALSIVLEILSLRTRSAEPARSRPTGPGYGGIHRQPSPGRTGIFAGARA
jgi:enoyl-CoA hydratase/carnithine racemase